VTRPPAAGRRSAADIVCCSLEPWDDVWRRNQFLATELLALRPSIRILFVGVPADMTWSLIQRRRPFPRPGLHTVGASGRLWTLTPRKWLPRRLRPNGDAALGGQVRAAVRRLGWRDPVLWINDNSYAQLLAATGWPSVYDVTDDWLLATQPDRTLERQRCNDTLMLQSASEVVVCSPALAASRGRHRRVHLIPNGVDLAALRRPQPRPDDLPGGAVVLYQGSLNDGRLDIDLCVEIAERLAGMASTVFVGPSSLSPASEDRLRRSGAILLGPRPSAAMPGYMQHADALIVPHEVNPFTESLDPIKAREFVAVGRPTVATSVAGFRDLGPPVRIATPGEFVHELVDILAEPSPPGPGPLTTSPATWTDRAVAFLAVLDAAVAGEHEAQESGAADKGPPMTATDSVGGRRAAGGP
jgi:teichuronic acid biosynthesis glycosyltransferase TuaH